jgi:16S rRNA (cytosine967-C5)-methyltransferase
MSRVQPARQVALDVLRAVEQDDAYANLLLPQRIVRARLGAQDAGLATELTYGTLRLRGYYDRVIALAARRGTDAIDPALLDVLRLGTHQPSTRALSSRVRWAAGRAPVS